MPTILIVYESRYGQAQKIAGFVEDLGRRRAFDTKVTRASEARALDVHDVDAVVVVAPIYGGVHPRAIRRFLAGHADILSTKPTAFVSVSNAVAGNEPESWTAAISLATRRLAALGLRPDVVTAAGGALAYPKYGPLLRWFIRRRAKAAGQPTDTTRVHELTDWRRLGEALAPVLDRLDRRRGRASGAFRIRPDVPRVQARVLR